MKLPATLICTLLALASVAGAESVKVPVGQQGNSIEKPRSGITKDSVRERFGKPRGIEGPIGEPPIYRWEYERFVVYFEHDRVIHTVTKFTPPENTTSQ